jgi:alpha-tubulin suppressor-like RCC1 family protein
VKFWRGTALSLGSSFSCGLRGDDSVACWGANALGQLGDGTATGHDRPTSNHFLGIAQVATGGAHGCLLTKTGEIWCWGANRDGQVGDGSTLLHTVPEMVRL